MQPDIYHNSFDRRYREPFGAVPRGSTVYLAIAIHDHLQPKRVFLHSILDKSNQEQISEMNLCEQRNSYQVYEIVVIMPEEPQLIWYYFEIETVNGHHYYGRASVEESGEGKMYEHIPPSWQITVYNPEYVTPKWWKNAIMYQIFPDRFYRFGELALDKAPKGSLIHSHWEDEPIYFKNEAGEVLKWDFFGGNLQGIIKKMEYLHSLGIMVIYLNPIFKAESNHRYDTGDYHNVDPLLGNEEDLKELIKVAAEFNIEIMLDGVFSHTGSNSLYFNQKGEYDSLGAYQSVDSPYYNWYTFHLHPTSYDTWWGVKTLPTINKNAESYRQFLIHRDDSVIKTWQHVGVKHWRLDVADELPDMLIKQIFQQVKKVDESSVLLGEVWEDASNKIAYGIRKDYLLGGVLDSVMNYPLRKGMLEFLNEEISASILLQRLMTCYEHYPLQYFYSMMNLLSSHDTERIKTVLRESLPRSLAKEEKCFIVKERLKALSLWQYTFPGVPSLYYGDEAGVTGGKDPENRKPFPWGREDRLLVEWYKTIGKWRRKYQALRTGNWRPHAFHDDVFGYERWIDNGVDVFGDATDNGHFFYLLNRNKDEVKDITILMKDGKWQNMVDNRIFHVTDQALPIRLKPSESMLLRYTLENISDTDLYH